ncbi:MAG: DUF3900 domain-containing protein [Candidatus Riflebacteria bacterium]|nr:DUF3900 domain-containing protein [Candidatus Riflebacteria bacterium]
MATIDSGRAKGIPFYVLFKCDFEDARRLTPRTGLERVDEIIENRLKKMAMFPYFNGFEQDGSRVKIFQSNPSDYFHELLEVQVPATAKQLFQKELKEAVGARHHDRYDDYFVGLPPEKRELFGEERFIPLSDLLPPPEVNYVTQRSCQAVREKYDKKVKATIKVDGTLKVEMELDALGKSFFFARKGDVRYMIIRGESFVTSGQLSGLDFLNVEELDDILPRVTEEISKEGEDA